MDDLLVQRVLVELSRITTDLEELEAAERVVLADRSRAATAAGPRLRDDLRRAEERQLGLVEGLVEAQLAVLARRQQFARAHRPGSADWINGRIGRIRPPTGGVSPADGRDDQGDQGHRPDRTPGP